MVLVLKFEFRTPPPPLEIRLGTLLTLVNDFNCETHIFEFVTKIITLFEIQIQFEYKKKGDNTVVSLSRIGWLNFSDQF